MKYADTNPELESPLGHRCLQCPVDESATCGALDIEHTNFIENCKNCRRILPAGTTIYHEGDVCKELYVLVDGWASISRSQTNGKQLILGFLMPGAFLGFQADLMSPMQNRIKCITDAMVCVYPRRTFTALLEKDPTLVLSFIRSKAAEDEIIRDNLIKIATQPARARVAHVFLELHSRVVKTYPHKIYGDVNLPLTQQNIADHLGLTNVHVSRAIGAMQREKLLSFKKNRLQIYDFEKLSEIAGYSSR